MPSSECSRFRRSSAGPTPSPTLDDTRKTVSTSAQRRIANCTSRAGCRRPDGPQLRQLPSSARQARCCSSIGNPYRRCSTQTAAVTPRHVIGRLGRHRSTSYLVARPDDGVGVGAHAALAGRRTWMRPGAALSSDPTYAGGRPLDSIEVISRDGAGRAERGRCAAASFARPADTSAHRARRRNCAEC